jgi:type III restriction enzyme
MISWPWRIDEQKEVLIFKVAVALGFDAPRAFTLVSMRGAKDTDFGIQVVGRILRVHSKLQGPTLESKLPELLRNGYVFLADAANQSGLVQAGDKINAIQQRTFPRLPIHDGSESCRTQ